MRSFITKLTKNKRRRAQNRASQQAFREKRKKHIKELEEGLARLEGQHGDLTQLFESLQFAYTRMKTELETLRRRNSRQERVPLASGSYDPSSNEWANGQMETSNPLLFNVSGLYNDQELDDISLTRVLNRQLQ